MSELAKRIEYFSGGGMKEFSKAAEVSIDQIKNILAGRSRPRYLTMVSMADTLGVTMDQLREMIEALPSPPKPSPPLGDGGASS